MNNRYFEVKVCNYDENNIPDQTATVCITADHELTREEIINDFLDDINDKEGIFYESVMSDSIKEINEEAALEEYDSIFC